MVVRVIEAKEDKVTIPDLLKDLKKNTKIDYCGAIFISQITSNCEL